MERENGSEFKWILPKKSDQKNNILALQKWKEYYKWKEHYQEIAKDPT